MDKGLNDIHLTKVHTEAHPSSFFSTRTMELHHSLWEGMMTPTSSMACPSCLTGILGMSLAGIL